MTSPPLCFSKNFFSPPSPPHNPAVLSRQYHAEVCFGKADVNGLVDAFESVRHWRRDLCDRSVVDRPDGHDPARILVLFVVMGVVLTAIGLYEPIVEFAGAGATVPLTGFGYTLAKGVEEAVKEKGLLGVLTGSVTGAAGGITAAVVFSYLVALVAKSGDKS